MTDTILLTIPTDPEYRGVATLVLGGIGTRLDLPYERTDELQLAVLSLLDASSRSEVSLFVDTDGDGLRVSVGPVANGSGADPGLLRVLERLVGEVASESRDGEEWLALRLSAQR